ncbi:hypothetical protein EVAR_56537_1 [Eumeta japonica]|uniref:Uncharacterized protein n=1 Tax=Eumeta variegata TaxID=151549 RepID=A0A4C1Z029_EUMVA|nr:hypothetical protein EVAR_56537_1 [Eumeta japonica]
MRNGRLRSHGRRRHVSARRAAPAPAHVHADEGNSGSIPCRATVDAGARADRLQEATHRRVHDNGRLLHVRSDDMLKLKESFYLLSTLNHPHD